MCYVFHLQLEGVLPKVWRRLEIRKNKTFWDLHCAIQDVMPWEDKHLHEFQFPSGDAESRIGIPDDFDEFDVLASWETRLKDWLSAVPEQCVYVYDFGDHWIHTLTLEAIRPAEKGAAYPRCLGGERHCPPEDVGGPHGYESFLEALADPSHDEHQGFLEWIGGAWDADDFRAETVRFSRPSMRLRYAGIG